MPIKLKWVIAILMGATVFRAQTILFLSSVETFGGPAPDAWFGPWLSDAILGFLVPVMVFLFWRSRSVKIWGALVVYNGIGAFDYSQGLITQVLSPMPAEMASPTSVYAGIAVFLVMQLVVLVLLFSRTVVRHFCLHK
ncbi:MAG: hypothetical protein JJ850_15705 [Kordiimonadaceae bacterium]|nr:hypothetical protein [Kordiimonadaceae bacterium]MBO6569837.1 hypothetical protein [Kordiimonadaceae bacterium]MBO6966067.1 hypothetical protein [Kordiimonadaceae bacterium]